MPLENERPANQVVLMQQKKCLVYSLVYIFKLYSAPSCSVPGIALVGILVCEGGDVAAGVDTGI